MNFMFRISIPFLLFFFSLNMASAAVVNVADHGVDPMQATPVVRAIVDSVDANTTIVFPKGVYHFYTEGAAQQFCAITNNDNGIKYTPFPLIGKKGIVIEGNGSTFVFHGRIIPFMLERSQDITLRGFTVNWEYPFHLEGEVISVDESSKSFRIKVIDGFHYSVQNGELNIVGEGWSVPAGQNIFWNRQTRAPYYNTQTFNLPPLSIRAREVSPGVVEITSKSSKKLPPVGAIYVDKGRHLENRLSPAIRIYACRDINLTDLTILHAGAMGVIGERSENISVIGMKITAAPGRHVSTTADATHFANCKGKIVIRDCSFAHMLDDATNVHGVYLKVIRVEGRTVYAEPIHPHQYGYNFAEKGDKVGFTDNRTLSQVGTATVVEAERIHDRYYRFEFDREVAGVLEPGFGIDNLSWSASLDFVNNRVLENRARSILISTPGKVLVEDNYFSSMMMAIRISGDVNFWYESGPVQDVTIRNNVFEDCNYGGGKFAALIQIDPQIESQYLDPEKPYHRNITIENNRIKSFDSPILYACSVDGLTVRNNAVEMTHTYQPFLAEVANFVLEACRNVTLTGNTVDGRKPTAEIADNVLSLKTDM